jgi:hypothetical protein
LAVLVALAGCAPTPKGTDTPSVAQASPSERREAFPVTGTAWGAIDFSQVSQVARGYDAPAIGHGGEEPSNAARIVAFPQMDVVVAVQAYGTLYDVGSVVEALRDAAQP